MANALSFTFIHVLCLLLHCSASSAQNVVFQPSFLTIHGPSMTALLYGFSSKITLNLQAIPSSNVTGSFVPPSCVPGVTQWILTSELIAKTAVQVKLRLNRSLRLCGNNETDTDCCVKPLCVLETLQLTACEGNTSQASLIIQVKIYALLGSGNMVFDNSTIIQNQVYRPLGDCPCDLTFNTCDLWCCCDKDCSTADFKLFRYRCLTGPFGGQFPDPEYQCSVQSTQNSPDWFPFLCVTSPPENNPYLGLFYQGNTMAPKPGISFGGSVSLAPALSNAYTEGSPILTIKDQYFTIPQTLNGHCVTNAPVAFLKNLDVRCVTSVQACPTEFPLQTIPEDLRAVVKNGIAGNVVVDVTDQLATELNEFVTSSDIFGSSGLVCENVTLALDYNFHWKENGITGITLTRTVGSVTLKGNVSLTTRYSAMFLSGDIMSEPNSGNPGYQVGRPVIGGILNTSIGNDTVLIARSPMHLWKPVNSGICSSADVRPLLFGENSTSGCLIPVSRQNLTECSLLRNSVHSLQGALIEATLVARNGHPDALTLADWLNITYVTLNSSGVEDSNSSCADIPSHLHIYLWTLVSGFVDGIPQKDIKAVQISYSLSSWRLKCGGGDSAVCMDPAETQLLPITSSVTFIDIPLNTGPPKTRYQINFTEYDCNRNDVCWPELAFPITRFYTGESYSQALAKGLILVFFFIVASVLGNPWRQIRQIWNTI
ncbi:tectonic-2 isoform X2 [Boleophthalmus pectinirostris]|uniref:tectonic-2 isoform X2 n=1 Tax=Boleophthalmus pectinirostris TaxID=150288 RepID=UPI000A1C4B31|nr:tectonic-2 isoform X2 [Boleophthalmus pectinirostris]